MHHKLIFIIIIISLIIPLNTKTKAKFYLIEDYHKSVENPIDTYEKKTKNETIKIPKMSRKLKKNRATNISEDYDTSNGDVTPQASDILSDEAKSFMDEIEQQSPGYKLIEGDMILDPNQQKSFGDISADYMKDKNQAFLGSQWPNNKMYYTFDGTVEEDFKNTIRNAVNELAEKLKGCIEIVEGDNENCVIVSAKNNRQCVAMVGVNKHMKNTLNLDPNRCNFRGLIQHEFIHALGIFHHQSRKDRDKYIKINWHNIMTAPKDMTHNFKKREHAATYNLPYDYHSIMHYGGGFFSKNEDPTIETRNPDNQKKIGLQKFISPGDVKLIKTFYGCTGENDLSLDCMEVDTDYFSNDIVSIDQAPKVRNWQECSETCRDKYANCKFWTFVVGKCLVKTSKDGKRNKQGAISGSRECGSNTEESGIKKSPDTMDGSGITGSSGETDLSGGSGTKNSPDTIDGSGSTDGSGQTDVSGGSGTKNSPDTTDGSGSTEGSGQTDVSGGSEVLEEADDTRPLTAILAASPGNGDVSCGGHRAEDCSKCGSGSNSCNGDCNLKNGNLCVAKNGGDGGNNIPPQITVSAASTSNGDVSCGGHRAEDCSKCGSGAGSCNGDCNLINGNKCAAKNGGNGGKNVPLQATVSAASSSNGDVSCGGHRAENCSKCGSGAGSCNGDCNLINGNMCAAKNGGNGGNNVPLQTAVSDASSSNRDVSCGGHRAEDCSKCGSGSDSCNGDCHLINGNNCVAKK